MVFYKRAAAGDSVWVAQLAGYGAVRKWGTEGDAVELIWRPNQRHAGGGQDPARVFGRPGDDTFVRGSGNREEPKQVQPDGNLDRHVATGDLGRAEPGAKRARMV